MKSIQGPPDVVVELEGVAISADEARALGEVYVRQQLSLPSLCQLRFFDPPQNHGRLAKILAGAALRVLVRGHQTPLFIGEVTAVEHLYGPDQEHELRIRGYELLHRLRKRQPVRAHVQVDLGDLAREIVADLGYSVEADAGPLSQKLLQYRQSDLELLTEIAQRAGLYFTLRENVLHFLTLDGMGDPLQLNWGTSLLEARIEVNGDAACRSVSTFGWDPLRMEEWYGVATNPRVGRAIAAEVPPERVGSDGHWTLTDRAVCDERQADSLAQAELDRRVAREVVLSGMAEGDPRLRPGAIVDVRGVLQHLEGQYVVSSVTHVCDGRQGFVSQIDTAPPAGPSASAGATMAYGMVTSTEDNEGIGRIRVKLPAFGNLETEWMPVVTAGAGAGKGLMMLPDVGDRVLVLFSQSDPLQGVVVGSVYGGSGPPDAGIDGGSVRRYTLLTPGGQRLQLDDAKGIVRLENLDGSTLELSPGRVRLHARSDLEISAPGHGISIEAAAINFRKA